MLHHGRNSPKEYSHVEESPDCCPGSLFMESLVLVILVILSLVALAARMPVSNLQSISRCVSHTDTPHCDTNYQLPP